MDELNAKAEDPKFWNDSANAQKLMREPRSAFITGARGSGKTSILKSLDSREQAQNQSLQNQVLGDTIRSFGVYFRMPDLFTQTTANGHWSALMPTALDPTLVSTYFFSALIEVTAIELLLRNIHEWCAHALCDYTIFAAEDALSIISKQFPSVRSNNSSGNVLVDAAGALAFHRSRMLQAFCDGDVQQFKSLYRLSEPGDFLSFSVNALLPHTHRAPARCRLGVIRDSSVCRLSGSTGNPTAADTSCSSRQGSQPAGAETLAERLRRPRAERGDRARSPRDARRGAPDTAELKNTAQKNCPTRIDGAVEDAHAAWFRRRLPCQSLGALSAEATSRAITDVFASFSSAPDAA